MLNLSIFGIDLGRPLVIELSLMRLRDSVRICDTELIGAICPIQLSVIEPQTKPCERPVLIKLTCP